MPLICDQLGNTDNYYQTKCRYGLKNVQDVNAANLETFPNTYQWKHCRQASLCSSF